MHPSCLLTLKGPSEKEEKPQDAAGDQCKNEVMPKLPEEDVAKTEALAKKKSNRERKEERQNVKKEKKELRLQRQQNCLQPLKVKKSEKEKCEGDGEQVFQSSCAKVTKKKRRAIDAVEPEVNGNGLHSEEPGGIKPSAKKCKRSPSEGTKVAVGATLVCKT